MRESCPFVHGRDDVAAQTDGDVVSPGTVHEWSAFATADPV